MAERIADDLDYVGVLAVEMFVSDGELLVNEFAPARTTAATGRSTRAAPASSTSRSAPCAGWPRRAGDDRAAVAMVNLLGDLWADGEPDWERGARRAATRGSTSTASRNHVRPQDGPPHGARRDPEHVAAAGGHLRAALTTH